MIEVEVKASADHSVVRERLLEKGSEFLGRVRQTDTYFEHPSRSFVDTDEALRIRQEFPLPSDDEPAGAWAGESGSVVSVTYKGPKIDSVSKTRRELETTLGDAQVVRDILMALGFSPVAPVNKTRERYRVGAYTVTLDVVEDLGPFVEIETETDAGCVADLRAGAFDLLVSLGVSRDETIQSSYLELLLEK